MVRAQGSLDASRRVSRIRKHLRTVYPFLRNVVAPPHLPPTRDWRTTLSDPEVGEVALTGHLREVEGATDVVVVLHGLGGTTDSYYVLDGRLAAERLGMSSLALSLRGADRRGHDFYNIALTADLEAAVKSPELQRYERIYFLSYSMGGYVALHYACEVDDPRVRGVAAVCTPLDLAIAQRYIDTARALPYRFHVLNGLKSIYARVAERRPVPTEVARVMKVRTIREWDRLTIVPRYGFDSPEHYYEKLSIVPRLGELRVPTILLLSPDDPVVPTGSIVPFIERANRHMETVWAPRSGHLAFPRDLDLGWGPLLGANAQLLARLAAAAR